MASREYAAQLSSVWRALRGSQPRTGKNRDAPIPGSSRPLALPMVLAGIGGAGVRGSPNLGVRALCSRWFVSSAGLPSADALPLPRVTVATYRWAQGPAFVCLEDEARRRPRPKSPKGPVRSARWGEGGVIRPCHRLRAIVGRPAGLSYEMEHAAPGMIPIRLADGARPGTDREQPLHDSVRAERLMRDQATR